MLKHCFKISRIPLTLRELNGKQESRRKYFIFLSTCARVHCIDAIIVFWVHLTGTTNISNILRKSVQEQSEIQFVARSKRVSYQSSSQLPQIE